MEITSFVKKIKKKLFNFRDKNGLFFTKTRVFGANNRIIRDRGCRISNLQIKIFGDNNIIHIGRGTKIENMKIDIRSNGGSVTIGESCRMFDLHFMVEGPKGGKISIGRGAYCRGGNFSVYDSFDIEVGDDCLLAHGLDVMTGDAHSIIDLETQKRMNKHKSIKIHNHVWICAKVAILKGVEIGSNSIVGLGSVVAKSIPPDSLAVGVPAKVIKKNISWDEDRTMTD